MDYLVVLLGGRVTEHLIFGQITTGASDDLRKVHEISRSMVTDYGMGTQAPVQAAAGGRLLDVRRHPPADRRGAAVHRRPGPPAGAGAGGRAPAAAGGLRRHRCWRTRCSSASDIERPGGRARGRAAAPRPPRAAGRPGGEARVAASEALSRAVRARRLTSRSAGSRLRRRVRRDRPHRRGRGGPGRGHRPLPDRLGMREQHRETRRGVRRGGRAAGDRRRARGAAHARPARQRRGQVPRAQRPRACTTWPTAPTTSTPRWSGCARAGLRLIDEQPRTGIRESRVAFLHPKSTGGVLTEIVQPKDH